MIRWLAGALLLVNLSIFLWGISLNGENAASSELIAPGLGQISLYTEGSRYAEMTAETNLDVVEPPLDVEEVLPTAPLVVAVLPSVKERVKESIQDKPNTLASDETLLCGQTEAVFDEALLAKAAEKMKGLGFDVTTKTSEKSVITGYRVLVGPEKDRAAGQDMVAKLRSEGINDVWLFPDGPLKNTVSLGLFAYRLNAQRHASRIRPMGFDVKVREKADLKTTFSLLFNAKATADDYKQLKLMFPELQFVQIDCD